MPAGQTYEGKTAETHAVAGKQKKQAICDIGLIFSNMQRFGSITSTSSLRLATSGLHCAGPFRDRLLLRRTGGNSDRPSFLPDDLELPRGRKGLEERFEIIVRQNAGNRLFFR